MEKGLNVDLFRGNWRGNYNNEICFLISVSRSRKINRILVVGLGLFFTFAQIILNHAGKDMCYNEHELGVNGFLCGCFMSLSGILSTIVGFRVYNLTLFFIVQG